MPNSFFTFKQFTVSQVNSAMKVTTDACLFGAWASRQLAGAVWVPDRILDIGTGTGLLTLMLAQRIDAPIDAIEIDAASAQEAAMNIHQSPWKERIVVHHRSVQDFDPGYGYDVIVCNPPFYTDEWRSPDAGRARAHHGTHLSMLELVQHLRRLLQPGGRFFLLLPFKRREELSDLFQRSGIHLRSEWLVYPVEGHACFRYMIEGSFVEGAEISSGSISIKDQHQQYTKEFSELLKDYYLYL